MSSNVRFTCAAGAPRTHIYPALAAFPLLVTPTAAMTTPHAVIPSGIHMVSVALASWLIMKCSNTSVVKFEDRETKTSV